ncbi:hypothetical protein ACWD4G_34530 [Streptomyces sp. NPDC002643]
MISNSMADGPDETAERWLARQRALMNDLDGVLDVEAGLREVLLGSRTAAMVDDLDGVLDVAAGLREVLPSASPAPEDRPQGATARAESPYAGQPLSSVDPQTRMRLRVHPGVVRAGRDLASARALASAIASARDRAHALELRLSYALDIALDLDDALGATHARDLPVDLHQTLDTARDRALGLSLALDLALRSRTRTRARERALIRARAVSHEHAQYLDHYLTVSRSRAHAHGLTRALAPGLDHAGALLNDLVLALACDLDEINTVVRNRAEAVRQALEIGLGRKLPPLDEESLDRFLNDFTASDLRTADLNGIDLYGVRWSIEGTRWPQEVDLEDLKARSVETPQGSGIWIVRQQGNATVWDTATL